MRLSFRRAFTLAALAAAPVLALAPGAAGVESCVGPLCVSATATLQPRELPKHGNAPVTLSSVIRVKSKDGTPPTLQTVLFLIDKHGTVNAREWPTCSLAKLEATTPSQARQRCAGALVGKGFGKALVSMPGKAPFAISSMISFFNGAPSGGRPTLIAHAYQKSFSPHTLLVPIAIERVSGGRYGFRARVEIPPIAEGFGAPLLAEATIGATRTSHGKKIGYIGAHCNGGRLQVYGTMSFTNGDFFPTTLTSPCHFPR